MLHIKYIYNIYILVLEQDLVFIIFADIERNDKLFLNSKNDFE